jgi:hypothetical protein
LVVSSTVREHQPVTVKLVYAQGSGPPATWRVTLDSITCGPTPFRPAVIRSDEASMGEPYSMPTPSSGTKFCLVEFSASNLSTSNQNWQAAQETTLNVAQDTYAPYQAPGTNEDPASAYQNWADHHGVTDTAFGVNPGISGVDYAVYEISSSARPTSVSVDASAYSQGPVALITLPGTSQKQG